MKKILVVLFCTIFAISMASAQEAKKKNNKVTTRFFVETIHCENCIKNIEKNISFEKGVTDMKCNLETRIVEVTFRPDKTSNEKLLAVFDKIQKPAKVLKEGEKPEVKHDGHNH